MWQLRGPIIIHCVFLGEEIREYIQLRHRRSKRFLQFLLLFCALEREKEKKVIILLWL